MKSFPNPLFINYVQNLQSRLELLKKFEINKFEEWHVDWNACLEVYKNPSKYKPWSKIPVFENLSKLKAKPAVYFFTVETQNSEIIFNTLLQRKKESLAIRKEKGIKDVSFLNVSYVPKEFKKSDCIYVGSRMEGLHGRLIQHLGFSSSGRTGALYLYQLFKSFDQLPNVKFHYYILDEKFREMTKHIECVVQDNLKPFIGKRAL